MKKSISAAIQSFYGEEKMDWRKELKEIVGTADDNNVADLTDMEEREILEERHLGLISAVIKKQPETDSDVIDYNSHI
ncbi:hypothetical protein [Porcincola intestinalis]|uniref:Uncharacterized protein n=1 Tax=Porcincola intestinalis TaxID=2606632 RepID=A0A6L5X3Q7_9FIRM|nr:hypothetical protein [Porcincola intestinalis]MSS13998.1 hypothetical protein [Porcincola intestinalis]